MKSLARKRLTLVIVAIVILVLSSATLIQFSGRTSSPVGPTTTSSNTATSLTQQESTSASSSSARVSYVIFSKVGSLFATPSVTLNYTFIISRFDTTASHVILSAASTVPGVTLTVRPSEFNFLGTQEPISLGISVTPKVNSSILPVEIIASTTNGETNSTFDFILNKNLVVVLPDAELTPSTLHLSAGQTVTWLNLADNSDANGLANVLLGDGSAPSPTIRQSDVWSHTFDKPGTYPYQVTVSDYPTASGEIIVA